MACKLLRSGFNKHLAINIIKRFHSNVASAAEEVNQNVYSDNKNSNLSEYRFVFPEFLPDPTYEFRNKIREKLERMDMLKRRSVIVIPEFYVGSILAVVATDPYAPGKKNRFVGICIHRTYTGLRATFTLRNIVDGQGVEIMYDMYNPTILVIEVLKLEKRLDDVLFYLRDARPEFSTFPFDMEPEFRAAGEPVPVNPIKVKLKPFPWHQKWETKDLKGIESLEGVPLERELLARKNKKPWEAYDLMKEYRRCIPEEDQVEIWQDLEGYKHKFPKRKQAWKRSLQRVSDKKQ